MATMEHTINRAKHIRKKFTKTLMGNHFNGVAAPLENGFGLGVRFLQPSQQSKQQREPQPTFEGEVKTRETPGFSEEGACRSSKVFNSQLQAFLIKSRSASL